MTTTYELSPELQDILLTLTRKIARIEASVDDLSGEDGLALSTIEADDGSLDTVDIDGNPIISLDPELGVVVEQTVYSPPIPEAPDVTPGFNTLIIEYDGTFTDGDWDENQIDHVEIHVTALSTDALNDTNQVGTFVTSNGGTFTYPWDALAGGRWVRLQAVTITGEEGPPSAPVFGTPDPIAATDGIAPAAAPVVTVRGAIEAVLAKWAPVANADPVTYRVFMKIGSAPSIVGTTDLSTTTPATSVVISHTPAGVAISATDVVHVRVIPFDADGDGPASTDASATPIVIQTIDIAALAITTTTIGPDAITSPKITANTIIAGDVAANTLTSGEVATRSLLAGDLVATTITAAEIAGTTITAAQIAATTITATQIAATTITAAKIAARTITANEIAAGTITANEIKVATITADRIIIGDTTNTVVDSDADGLGTWAGMNLVSGGAGYSIVTATGPTNDRNGKVFRYTANNTYTQISEAMFPVTPGDTYHLSGWYRFTGTLAGADNCGFFLFFYDKTGAFVGTGSASLDTASSAYTTAWQKKEVDCVVPAGVAFAGATMRATVGLTGGNLEWDQVQAGRVLGGELLASTITGKTIRTAASGSRMQMENDPSAGVLKWFSGVASETAGFLNPGVTTLSGQSFPTYTLAGSAGGGFTKPVTLYTQTGGTSGAVTVIPNAEFTGSGDVDFSLRIATVHGGSAGVELHAGGAMEAQQVFAFNPGPSTAAGNVRWNAAGTGQFLQNTSLTKYKVKIKPIKIERLKKLLDVPVVEFYDRQEWLDNKRKTKGLQLIPGVLAEDVEKADTTFADYSMDGELVSVMYDRLGLALIPLVKDLYKRIEALENNPARK